MVVKVLILSFFVGSCFAKVPSLTEKNKQADTSFLQWKMQAPGSAALKNLLTPEVITFVIEESQLPLDKPLSDRVLEEHVQRVAAAVLKKFDAKDVKKRELDGLIRVLIRPEYTFQVRKPLDDYDKAYNNFFGILKEQKTPLGTTLDDWALRFLTSEAITVALPMIERLTIEGKTFHELSPLEKKQLLDTIHEVVTKRFMDHLKAVRIKFKFQIPELAESALRRKIDIFLTQKFAH